MGKVVKLNARQHIYNVDNCAGCGVKIYGYAGIDYLELGLPWDDTVVEHIALCEKCEEIADSYGVLPE